MKKNLFLFLLLVISTHTSFAQLKSPDEFLGYPIGTKFTPHYKIVNYFQYVVAAMPQQMQLNKYGETYEGRPLYLAFISSAANISNLAAIRKNNLQLAGLESGTAANSATPIVWLSYNVHGNEASSSEAAMQTLYELLRPDKPEHQQWLSNTVVIMDPCLNPDGRDRYVNWFNGMVGRVANPQSFAREHEEPWPGGRLNHYNFDLNRDWAWQTQIETKERIIRYNQWMPQVHVDYHEQGYNEPYYFAPAAAPFHEVITGWQKDFQTQIGKNNAKYFDNNGWLYFTKERFDLFYPSYGDTYPTYNGSIGMTYEQGGHSRGGLAVQTDEGEVLTLKDRLLHHTTTGLSTVEITSKNADKVIAEYKKYFDNARAGIGSNYKAYLLTSNDFARINAVQETLRNNGIAFKNAPSTSGLSGYNYFTGKNEIVKAETYTIVINANQPRSVLAKVLLEPVSKLVDSATYDITAWSIPYAYGVNAYALNAEVKSGGGAHMDYVYSLLPQVNYGIAVSYSSVHDAGLLAALLKAGVGIRVNEKDIIYKGKKINKGSLLILKRDNINKWDKAEQVINSQGAEYTLLDGGFMDAGPDMGSPDVLKLAAPRVVCITGSDVNPNAAGEIWHLFDQQIQYPLTMLNGNSLRIGTLKQFDILILPDGDHSFIGDKKTGDDIKAWVRSGGRIIALESAVSQLADAEWGIKIKKGKDDDKKDDDYTELRKYGNRERDDLVNSIPGAIYKVEMDDTHPLAFGIGSTFYTLKQNSTVLEFLKDGWNVGSIKKENKVAGFAGSTVSNKIKDGTLFAVQDMGRGKVIYMVDDPVFRNFWENGKLLFLNAVFMVGNEPVRL
ncbi:M14 family metallopeptidase [Ferruginibacter sp.]|nr:zinc carboxypeptidase [Ferruginibacter sp.]